MSSLANKLIETNSGAFINTNGKGELDDLFFLLDAGWLVETEVVANVVHENGRWSLYLVFASSYDRFRFIRKKINTYPTKRMAQISADLLRRGAGNDPRGYLKVNPDDFHLCYN